MSVRTVPSGTGPFRAIGLAAERRSPENPDGAEIRAALTPAGVAALVRHGCAVAVERGAGTALGLPDAAYAAAGAALQDHDALYRDKDLVIKLKGPAHRDLARMDPGSTLLCMVHARSVPERVAVAEEHGVNLLAMEEIRECPERLPDALLRARLAMRAVLGRAPDPPGDLALAFTFAEAPAGASTGLAAELFGALQYAARCRPAALRVVGSPALARGAFAVPCAELVALARALPAARVDAYRASLPVRRFGRRRIHCLHETGRAGARFGVGLALRRCHGPAAAAGLSTVVLGYGNVAFGALDECLRQGVAAVEVLTRRTALRPAVRRHLATADLVVNGIELAPRLRGRHYVITDDDLGTVLRPGTVVVDLVGGCPGNRTPVQPVVSSTSPLRPCVVRAGVHLASVWGWPLLGFARESAERYSAQIVRLLLEDEHLADGLATAPPGVRRALVAGPAAARCGPPLPGPSPDVALSATLNG
ncbi:hypothetical protein GCM10010218_04110 [Streptomyces mashuensis]|uniref:Alanine dehydrogenase/pyridine nucleotide transhydrogenase N-terminal domain-containing protein n=1 Tax=Streptomyces mashuensis TaxID=33904 RepID=A0A919E976_9ACTN|nr:alanine dehydrogenase [Streptomyces mashuensis]GHF26448.1 hypothetical protein GCM10010218_04110 [Streptomyces mashuensis]